MPLSLGVKLDSQSSKEAIAKGDDIYKVVKTFDLVYYVVSDAVGDDFSDVRTASGVPNIGSPLNNCYCDNIEGSVIDRVVHPQTFSACELWEITCSFTDQWDSSKDPDDDPIDHRPIVRWYSETENEVMDEERRGTGEAVVTANGEKILVEGPITIPVLEITRNEYGPTDPNLILAYANKVNKKKFWGAPPGTALMMGPDTREFYHKDKLYIEVVYTIKFKFITDVEGDIMEDSWAARVLHHGTLVKEVLGGPIVQAKDDRGNPVTKNLDANGVILAPGADPVFLTFWRHDEIDFNALSLGPF